MKNEENKMTIKQIINARCNGDKQWIEAIEKKGEIGFGCNPNWLYPNMLHSYMVKGSQESQQTGRCISRTTFTAFDGETTIRVSYESDSSD